MATEEEDLPISDPRISLLVFLKNWEYNSQGGQREGLGKARVRLPAPSQTYWRPEGKRGLCVFADVTLFFCLLLLLPVYTNNNNNNKMRNSLSVEKMQQGRTESEERKSRALKKKKERQREREKRSEKQKVKHSAERKKERREEVQVQCCFYVDRDHKDNEGRGARDDHLHFPTATEL